MSEVHHGGIVSGEHIISDGDIALSVKEVEEPIKLLPSYPALEAALRKGGTLHAFSSGGGLRVFRLEGSVTPGKRGMKLLAYGEHPHAEIALRHTEEDCAAGGRKYDDVYGKLYDHYLTGSRDTSSNIDRFLRVSRSFDIYFKRRNKGSFVLSATYLYEQPWPKAISDYVSKTLTPFTWKTQDGTVYEMSPFRFANGEMGTSLKTVSSPNKKRRSCFSQRRIYFSARTFSSLLAKMEKEFAKTFNEEW